MVNLDLQLGQLVQASLQVLRCPAQVERQVGECVQQIQVGLVRSSGLCDVLGVEFDDLVENETSFRLQVVVALT
ncbi:hypothetical protein ADL03_21410 [Nocardia sp. NRRL S-836]|nr:hypothetical protein ADL03_21410 [Nocardia sp. NRRL S-836]